jgi:hypothetical protein
MLDGTNPKQTIWKILYPNYSKPFKKDENWKKKIIFGWR